MRKPWRRLYYKIGGAALLLICTFFLYFREQDDIDPKIKIMILERSIRSAMNQGECHHPQLPIDNPEVMKHYTNVERINCGNPLDDWVKCVKSICFIKPEVIAVHGDIICSYTDIIRKSDYKNKYGKTTKTNRPYELYESDFVKVVCNAENSGQSWFGMAHGIRDSVLNPPTPANIPPQVIIKKDANQHITEEKPFYFNVLMLGFDSMSRLAVMRKLPKSYKYLTEQLNAIVLKGYNIVGDGTPQALIPILTGYTELELPETRKRMRNSQSVNAYPMIWRDYATRGYITSFNEDIPNVGTFTYRLNGFDDQPVDHYLRTFYVEADNILSTGKTHCFGHQVDHMVMLDYTKNFMMKYSEVPSFLFSFHGGLSHDSINLIGAADDDVLEWLKFMKEKHILDNTILIFMADHGNRFSEVRATLQGKQEERLPFFSFTFPENFKKRFPEEYVNFVENAERLTTPFDIHATLKDLLKIQDHYCQSKSAHCFNMSETAQKVNEKTGSTSDQSRNQPIAQEVKRFTTSNSPNISISSLAKGRAISLFAQIPKNRSCADAYIEPHWCACLKWETLRVPNNTFIDNLWTPSLSSSETAQNGILIKSATSIVNAINNATSSYRSFCYNLELKKINWAMRLIPHKEMLLYKKTSDNDGFLADLTDKMHIREELYQLQIVVSPGDSLFEATVSYNLSNFSAQTKLSEISRINRYGEQANCIYERNPELRKYCYCRT